MSPEAKDGDRAGVPFWQRKTLAEMTPGEWESLCDGCGLCCLFKLDDEENGEIAFTNVACRLLDIGTCRCQLYENRHQVVPDCVSLTPGKAETIPWLPPSCAYRRIAENRDLAWWHPLVSGNPETVHEAGVSVRGRVVSETRIGNLDEELDAHIVDWPVK